jgi:hypothetical protein
MEKHLEELTALQSLISEAELILWAPTPIEDRTDRVLRLLRSALALTDKLLDQEELPAPTVLGSRRA